MANTQRNEMGMMNGHGDDLFQLLYSFRTAVEQYPL